MRTVAPGVDSYAEAYRVHRAFDYILVFIFITLLTGIHHLHAMLSVGDWTFWTDWKDRRWWLFVIPLSSLVFPVVGQYILWQHCRVPFGATLMVVCLLLGQWIDRVNNFAGWVYYPLNFVWPGTLLPSAIILDLVLMFTNSYVLTAVLGAWSWGILFYPSQWYMLGAFHLPVEYHGVLMSIADVQGFEYIRTGTPEYIRIIEKGTLRTFGQDVTPVSAFFCAFACILVYFVFNQFAKLVASVKFIKGRV